MNVIVHILVHELCVLLEESTRGRNRKLKIYIELPDLCDDVKSKSAKIHKEEEEEEVRCKNK